VRSPAFGIVVLTPVVLAGAVAASPGGPGVEVKADDTSLTEPVVEQRSEGVSVVAMSKPPADLRFASTSMGPPPPAAVLGSGSFAAGAGGLRIPAMALSAYRKAEQTMSAAAPGCGVSWNLLAGIGRIESSHANGGATDNRGTAVRPIYGPVLDGSLPGNEIIVQSNLGGRAVYARAMGPMQFLPGTWSRYAADGDGDGKSDPQNLFDASLSAARYLCSGGLNLRNQAQVMTAILRYNNSMAYAQNVLGWAAAYATGVAPLNLPAITGPVPALGNTHLESIGGLGPGMSGLPGGDPLAQLALGNSAEAGQLRLGHTPAVATGVAPEHGCEVICMASQLAPSQTPTSNLPPWLAPPPWMPQPLGAPMPGMMPLPGAPLPGPAPAGAPLPGPAPAGAPLPGMPPAPVAPLPGMPPAPAAPLPGMPPAPAAPLPGMPPAPAAPLPGMPPAPAAEVPFAPGPQTPPLLIPPPPPGAPVLGAPPGPPA
jgi:membrane-bound lytic murein transglycosylase B